MTDRVDSVRRQVMVLSDSFRNRYLEWVDWFLARTVDDSTAAGIIEELTGELNRLESEYDSRRINEAARAVARQQLRFVVGELLVQPRLSARTKQEIRRFDVEEFPPRLLEGIDGHYSHDWFYYHEEHWREHFGWFSGREGLRFLEIGSFEGRSTCWISRNLLTGDGCHIICVDPFTAHAEQEAHFDHNIRASGAESKVIKLRGQSQDVLRLLEPDRIDFIYVDGSHRGLDVMQDAAAAWRLLKSGGCLVFDDYEDALFGEKLGISCHTAVDAFLALVDPHFEVLFQDWQLAIRKR